VSTTRRPTNQFIHSFRQLVDRHEAGPVESDTLGWVATRSRSFLLCVHAQQLPAIMTTKEQFDAAVTHMKNVQLGNQGGSISTPLPKATLLRLYGCYKQATQGNITGVAPSRFSVIAFAKWQAWKALENTPIDEARQQYIDVIAALDPSFQSNQHSGRPQATTSSTITAVDETSAADANDPAFSDTAHPPPPMVRAGSLLVYTGYTCIVSALMLMIVSYIPPYALALIGLCAVGVSLIVLGVQKDLHTYGLLGYVSPGARAMLLNMTFLEWCLDDSVVVAIKKQWREIVPVFVQTNMTELLEALSNMSLTKRRVFTEKGIISCLPESLQRLVLSDRVYNERQAPKQYRPALEAGPAAAIERQRTDESAPALQDQEQLQARLMQEKVISIYETVVTQNVSQAACKRVAAVGALVVLLQTCVSSRTRKLLVSLVRALALVLPGLGAVLGVVFWLLIALQKKRRRMLELEAKMREKLIIKRERS
jgi:diazepam-binding inhibitor (GABA receptor modulating acyl-CoA-binding protein)